MLLITITGTTGSETVSDLQTYEQNPISRDALLERYVRLHVYAASWCTCMFHRLLDYHLLCCFQSLTKTFQNLRDVGFLVVKGMYVNDDKSNRLHRM